MLEKSELRYILYAGVFAFIFFTFLLPYLQTNATVNSNPYMQFLIFNIGIFVVVFIFLKSLSMGTKPDLRFSLGLLLLFLALDIWLPDFHITPSGELLPGATLGTSTTDYLIGLTGKSMGINGYLLYLFTYIFIPLALLFVAGKIMPNFVRRIG